MSPNTNLQMILRGKRKDGKFLSCPKVKKNKDMEKDEILFNFLAKKRESTLVTRKTL